MSVIPWNRFLPKKAVRRAGWLYEVGANTDQLSIWAARRRPDLTIWAEVTPGPTEPLFDAAARKAGVLDRIQRVASVDAAMPLPGAEGLLKIPDTASLPAVFPILQRYRPMLLMLDWSKSRQAERDLSRAGFYCERHPSALFRLPGMASWPDFVLASHYCWHEP